MPKSETALELATREGQIQPGQLDLIKRTVARGATDDQLAMFLYQCKRAQLDPLSRQIHCIVRRSKDGGSDASIQVGIDGYRLIADRTGLYAGNDDPVYDEGLTQYACVEAGREHPTTATATVYKMVAGQRQPFTCTAQWKAYCPTPPHDFMWRKMAWLMLGKCAEALALRKAFPQELSGMYTKEEMDQSITTADIVREEPPPPLKDVQDAEYTECPPPLPAPEPSFLSESEPMTTAQWAEILYHHRRVKGLAEWAIAAAQLKPKMLEVIAKYGIQSEDIMRFPRTQGIAWLKKYDATPDHAKFIKGIPFSRDDARQWVDDPGGWAEHGDQGQLLEGDYLKTPGD